MMSRIQTYMMIMCHTTFIQFSKATYFYKKPSLEWLKNIVQPKALKFAFASQNTGGTSDCRSRFFRGRATVTQLGYLF